MGCRFERGEDGFGRMSFGELGLGLGLVEMDVVAATRSALWRMIRA